MTLSKLTQKTTDLWLEYQVSHDSEDTSKAQWRADCNIITNTTSTVNITDKLSEKLLQRQLHFTFAKDVMLSSALVS